MFSTEDGVIGKALLGLTELMYFLNDLMFITQVTSTGQLLDPPSTLIPVQKQNCLQCVIVVFPNHTHYF